VKLEGKDYELICAARDVEMEVERYRSKSKGGSLSPLTYALVALRQLKPRTASDKADVQLAVSSAVTLVRNEFSKLLEMEAGRPIKTLLDEILPLATDQAMPAASARGAV
jgi:hypothetical protein